MRGGQHNSEHNWIPSINLGNMSKYFPSSICLFMPTQISQVISYMYCEVKRIQDEILSRYQIKLNKKIVISSKSESKNESVLFHISI